MKFHTKWSFTLDLISFRFLHVKLHLLTANYSPFTSRESRSSTRGTFGFFPPSLPPVNFRFPTKSKVWNFGIISRGCLLVDAEPEKLELLSRTIENAATVLRWELPNNGAKFRRCLNDAIYGVQLSRFVKPKGNFAAAISALANNDRFPRCLCFERAF